ncbi:hypothetical protein DRH27_00450 [Candidatus Falkowbacteria bacterium]|nr:MAG: hypothetical protein DRH27_00450 [Candidatus Falkowbacteria bacterium]
MELSIIIVSWNVKDRLRENLKALEKTKGDFLYEVIVVDNNSEDGTPEMVEKEFPHVLLVKNNANVGFAKANNQALRQVESDFVLLLNPDMLPREDTLLNMLNWMKNNPQASVAGCNLVNEQGETIKHVRCFPSISDQLAIVLKLPHIFKNILKKYIREDFDYTKDAKVDSVRGGFFMINRLVISDLKKFLNCTLPLLDEGYFLWFEEVDYCQQIKKAGGEVWYTPAAKCVDYIGQSFKQVPRGQAQKYFRNSQLKYFKKWHPAWQYHALKTVWLLGIIISKISEKFNIKSKAKT